MGYLVNLAAAGNFRFFTSFSSSQKLLPLRTLLRLLPCTPFLRLTRRWGFLSTPCWRRMIENLSFSLRLALHHFRRMPHFSLSSFTRSLILRKSAFIALLKMEALIVPGLAAPAHIGRAKSASLSSRINSHLSSNPPALR